jgi:hypothetical protein
LIEFIAKVVDFETSEKNNTEFRANTKCKQITFEEFLAIKNINKYDIKEITDIIGVILTLNAYTSYNYINDRQCENLDEIKPISMHLFLYIIFTCIHASINFLTTRKRLTLPSYNEETIPDDLVPSIYTQEEIDSHKYYRFLSFKTNFTLFARFIFDKTKLVVDSEIK